MTEAAYVFHQDVREKKSIKNSANKTNRTGKGPVRFPSDYMTKKERESLNGECQHWNYGHFYSWDEFLSMPDHIKSEYLNHLLNKYAIGLGNISEHVFGKSKAHLSGWLNKKPNIKQHVNVPKMHWHPKTRDLNRFVQAIELQRTTEMTHSQEDSDISEKDTSTEVPESFTPEERKFINRYLAPISEKKKDDPDDNDGDMSQSSVNPVMRSMVFEFDACGARETDMAYIAALLDMFGSSKTHIKVSVAGRACPHTACPFPDGEDAEEDCHRCWLDWLKSPSECNKVCLKRFEFLLL